MHDSVTGWTRASCDLQILTALSPLSLQWRQTDGMTEEKCPQLVDYFVVAGLDPAGPWRPLDEDGKTSTNSSSTPSSSSSSSGRAVESVTDLAVIARGLGEEVPEGFTCIERTLGGHSAELSAGLINNPHLYLCYRRGRDKPPILDLGWDLLTLLINNQRWLILTPCWHCRNKPPVRWLNVESRCVWWIFQLCQITSRSDLSVE